MKKSTREIIRRYLIEGNETEPPRRIQALLDSDPEARAYWDEVQNALGLIADSRKKGDSQAPTLGFHARIEEVIARSDATPDRGFLNALRLPRIVQSAMVGAFVLTVVFIVVSDGAKENLAGPEGYEVAEFSEPRPNSMGYLRSAYLESDQAFERALSMASQGVYLGVDPATARGRLFADLID